MKNNTLLTIAVCVAMICTPKVVTQTILTDKKEGNGNRLDKSVELIIPYYNGLDIDKIKKSKRITDLHKKEGKVKIYNAAICRGNTYRNNSNVRRVQRL